MRFNPDLKRAPVLRITIDEKLEDNLIRALAARLKAGVKIFSDDPDYWQEEEELYLKPSNYEDLLGLTRYNARSWPWNRLREGQVFLVGTFTADTSQGVANLLRVDPRRKYFRDIQSKAKDNLKKKYLMALERSVFHDKANQTR